MLTSDNHTVCNYLNFHPPEVVSRYREPQLQVGENYSPLVIHFDKLFTEPAWPLNASE